MKAKLRAIVPAVKHDVVVRLRQRAEEPEVADGGEVVAGAVLGPAVRSAIRPLATNAHACGERKCERRDLVRLVVARQRSTSDRAGRLRDGDRRWREEAAAAQARRSARMRAPVSSALGTKPRAPHVGDQLAVVGGIAARDEHDRRRAAVRAEPAGDLEAVDVRAAARRAARCRDGARLVFRERLGPVPASPTTVKPSASSSSPGGGAEARVVVDDQDALRHEDIVATPEPPRHTASRTFSGRAACGA